MTNIIHACVAAIIATCVCWMTIIAEGNKVEQLQTTIVEVCGPTGSGLLELDGRVYSCRQAEMVRGLEAAREQYRKNCERMK